MFESTPPTYEGNFSATPREGPEVNPLLRSVRQTTTNHQPTAEDLYDLAAAICSEREPGEAPSGPGARGRQGPGAVGDPVVIDFG